MPVGYIFLVRLLVDSWQFLIPFWFPLSDTNFPFYFLQICFLNAYFNFVTFQVVSFVHSTDSGSIPLHFVLHYNLREEHVISTAGFLFLRLTSQCLLADELCCGWLLWRCCFGLDSYILDARDVKLRTPNSTRIEMTCTLRWFAGTICFNWLFLTFVSTVPSAFALIMHFIL